MSQRINTATGVFPNAIVGSPTGTSSTINWHPKLTGYRLLVISVTTCFGLLKAILMYFKTYTASTTIEWLLTVVFGVVMFWLGLYEVHYPGAVPWLFEEEYGLPIWRALHRAAPSSGINERVTKSRFRERSHPPLMGYHLLISLSVITGGLTKTIFAYYGYSTVPNTLECIFAVLVGNGLYWLGLYDQSAPNVLPMLFEWDYTSGLAVSLFSSGYILMRIALMTLSAVLSLVLFVVLRAELTNKSVENMPKSAKYALQVYYFLTCSPLILGGAYGCIFHFTFFIEIITGWSIYADWGYLSLQRPGHDEIVLQLSARTREILIRVLHDLGYLLMFSLGYIFIAALWFCAFDVAKSFWPVGNSSNSLGGLALKIVSGCMLSCVAVGGFVLLCGCGAIFLVGVCHVFPSLKPKLGRFKDYLFRPLRPSS